MSEEFPHDFAHAARHVDLAILGQPRDGDPLIGQYALVERCLFASGRPVIIVPAAPEKLRAQGNHRRGMGRKRGGRAGDQRRADIPQAGGRVVLLVGVTARAGRGEGPFRPTT